jgi:AraC-like DNA-binding protein
MVGRVLHGIDGDGKVSSVRVEGPVAATPMHAHRSLILGLVAAGERTLTLANGKFVLRAGDGFVIAPDAPHAFSAVTDGCHRVVAIDEAALPAVRWRSGLVRDVEWQSAFDTLHAAAEAGSVDSEPLIAPLLRLTANLLPTDDGPVLAAGPVRLARRVASADLEAGLGLADIARRVGLSPFHLHRLYRKAYGLTPAEHRLEARLRLARQMILAGAAIAEVAVALGFADQSHLNRAFRRLMGVPPGAWVRQVRRAPPGARGCARGR